MGNVSVFHEQDPALMVAPYGFDGKDWKPQPGGPASFDAFGRARVSSPQTMLASKNILDNQPLTWDDAEVSGTGTGSSWDQDAASVTLTITDTTAGKRVRQSKARAPYQPGKSQRVFVTFTMDAPQAGLTQEVGLFDNNNGFFLRQNGSVISFVRRSNATGTPVETEVLQSAWSQDAMSDLDLEQSQILYIDFEWLGVGIGRMGFVIDGAIRIAHIFTHANAAPGVYMSTPNLPVRYSIESNGTPTGVTGLEAICASVDSEGGIDDLGISRSVDRGSSGLATGADTSIYPIVGIRLDSAGLDAFVRPTSAQVICTTTAHYRWLVLLNPVWTGTALTFADVANSAVESSTGSTNATTLSSYDAILASGYGVDTNQSAGSTKIDLGNFQLGSQIDGTSDEVFLCVQPLTGAAETFFAQMGWRESA